MSPEEDLPATDHDPGVPLESGESLESGDDDAEDTFPLPVANADADRPPTREEFERLAAEVRRLAGQIAHGRS